MLNRVADFRRFNGLGASLPDNPQEPRQAGVHSGSMTSSRTSTPINSASACRAKAASLRLEARAQASAVAVAQLLEIAGYWERLAMDYDMTEKPGVQKHGQH
jgi:hypothetical protein